MFKNFRIDFFIVVAFIFIGALGSYVGSSQLNFQGLSEDNVWFQADIGRVYNNMTQQHSNHYRTKVHPLFSLTTHPVVHFISKMGLHKYSAVKLIIGFVAGLWLCFFYLVLRLLQHPRFDSAIFSVLASVSASMIFWSTVPETFLFGSLSIILVLAFVAYSQNQVLPNFCFVAISSLSLSMTVTNWMSGIAASLANKSFKKSIRITIDSFVVVTVLWAIQRAIYPSADFFLLSTEETNYIFLEDSGGIFEKAVAFFFHSVVMPEIQILSNQWAPSWPFFSVQFSLPGSSGFIGTVTSLGWALLFLTGFLTAIYSRKNFKFKIVVLMILAGQFLLHLVYGDETFLYSLHWTPILIIFASFGLESKFRYFILGLTTLLIIGVAFNNYSQFDRVASELWSSQYPKQVHSEKQVVLNPKLPNPKVIVHRCR